MAGRFFSPVSPRLPSLALDYNNYNRRIPPAQLARQLAGQVHLFTLYGGARPLGVGLIVVGYDEVEKTYECYGIESSGS